MRANRHLMPCRSTRGAMSAGDDDRRERHAGDERRHEHPVRAAVVQRRRAIDERESRRALHEHGLHAT